MLYDVLLSEKKLTFQGPFIQLLRRIMYRALSIPFVPYHFNEIITNRILNTDVSGNGFCVVEMFLGWFAEATPFLALSEKCAKNMIDLYAQR